MRELDEDLALSQPVSHVANKLSAQVSKKKNIRCTGGEGVFTSESGSSLGRILQEFQRFAKN